MAAREERWPLKAAFVIARSAKTEASVVVVEIVSDGHVGRGEAVPYARYGETVEGVLDQLTSVRARVESGIDWAALQCALPPGAARNALDCALWDLKAKMTGVPAWRRAGLSGVGPVTTALTLSLDTPERMADAARLAADRPILKLKLGGSDDVDRVAAVREAAPRSRLVVDFNEALDFDDLRRLSPALKRLGVALIEQPLPADQDDELEGWSSPVPLCADESFHTRAELPACARRYACVNLKLDKTGGLTEALAGAAAARAAGLTIMVGCMVATSLAMAPALLLANGAEVVDLDGPLLLAEDRRPGLAFAGSVISPADPVLWG